MEVLLGAMVTNVDERGIEVQYKDGRTEQIAAVTKIWAAGVQASPLTRTLAEQTGASLDRAGRIGVNPDLTLPGYPEVFVVGDMIDLDHLPGVAQVAIQGAKYAAKEITRRLAGKPPQKPFHYFDKGSMATISRFRAVAMIGKLRLTGFIAWLLWLAVHLMYLTGFKNRVTALLHWAVSFVGRGSLGADGHRAADLRAQRRSSVSTAERPTWSPTPVSTTPAARSGVDRGPASGGARGAGAGRDPVHRLGRARPAGALTRRRSRARRRAPWPTPMQIAARPQRSRRSTRTAARVLSTRAPEAPSG